MEKLNLQVELLHNLKNVREQDPKDEEFLDVLEFLELECICQDQDHPHHSSEEDAEGVDEAPLHVENLLDVNSVHDGEEEEEVPPETTRCSKDSSELDISDEPAEEPEEAYLEELTKNKVKGRHKGKWQKTRDEHFCFSQVYPKFHTKVFGESDKEDTLATNIFVEATANKGHSSKEVTKYKLTIKKTESGVKVLEGPRNRTSRSGIYLHKCGCAHDRRLWKVWNMKEFQEAKRYHGMDEIYQFIKTEDDEEEFELTIVEQNEDTMYLRWTGEEPSLKKIK